MAVYADGNHSDNAIHCNLCMVMIWVKLKLIKAYILNMFAS